MTLTVTAYDYTEAYKNQIRHMNLVTKLKEQLERGTMTRDEAWIILGGLGGGLT
jgi:hypothetical protein